MTYTIKFASGGYEQTADTYEAAKAVVESRFPGAVIGHPGDLSDGGDVTRCWRDEESAENDSGYAAVASIYHT